jgi:hypothetical protein
MHKVEKYDGNFKKMDYTFYEMSIKIIKKEKNKLTRKKVYGKRRY